MLITALRNKGLQNWIQEIKSLGVGALIAETTLFYYYGYKDFHIQSLQQQ